MINVVSAHSRRVITEGEGGALVCKFCKDSKKLQDIITRDAWSDFATTMCKADSDLSELDIDYDLSFITFKPIMKLLLH